jgi:hypothetical protein
LPRILAYSRDHGFGRLQVWTSASTYSPLGVLSRADLAAGSVQGIAPYPEQQIFSGAET